MAKQLLYTDEARKKLLIGADQLARTDRQDPAALRLLLGRVRQSGQSLKDAGGIQTAM
jgi:hypothetical protein